MVKIGFYLDDDFKSGRECRGLYYLSQAVNVGIFETGKVESSRVVVVVVVVVGVQALNASHLDLDRHASNNVNSHLTSTHSEIEVPMP